MQERKHYKDIGYKPFLFYVIFGVTGDDIHPSQSRHHVDCLPESLDIHELCRPDHADYINGDFRLHTFSGNTYNVTSRFVDDFDNDDFNNAYCEVTIN